MENEVRLIDANAMVKSWEDEITDHPEDSGTLVHAVAGLFVESLKSAPTIDPESLRPQGRWIEKPWRPECSLCGFAGSLYDTPINPFKFCPNCGAKMEG